MSNAVEQIIANYAGESPGVLGNLRKLLNSGALAGTGKLQCRRKTCKAAADDDDVAFDRVRKRRACRLVRHGSFVIGVRIGHGHAPPRMDGRGRMRPRRRVRQSVL